MKLTAFILLSTCLAASAMGNAQGITLKVKDRPLQEVFSELEKQSGYNFVYTGQVLENAGTVTLDIKNSSIEEAVKTCLKGKSLSYSIVDKIVVIKPKDPSTSSRHGGQTGQSDGTLAPIDVSGRITNEAGEPVIATITVKGTRIATSSNANGEFILRGVDENAVLIITAANIETREIKVNGKTDLAAIAVKIKVGELEGVIIERGYFTEKEKTSVSNVVKVTAKDIEKQPVQNVLLASQGRVPGLFVTQSSGIAGGGVKVRIQGENSLSHGNDPLYVVDGVPIDAQLLPTGIDYVLGGAAGSYFGSGNPLNYLNPLDIESIEILKDADATAIYGSRAANGAILITTKKGKSGDLKIDINMQTGWGKMTRRVEMMNTRQYLDMRYEAFANDGIDWRSPSVSAIDLKLWDTTRYTNWQDELLGGTAHYSDVNASVSGGTGNFGYLVSGTWHKETTVFPLPSDFGDRKASVHFNLNASSSNQKFRLQLSGSYMYDKNQLPWQDMTRAAVMLEPHAPQLLNADGSINWAPDANGNSTHNDQTNPMIMKYVKYVNRTYNLVSSLKLDYSILPSLTIGSSFGYNRMLTNDFVPGPLISVAPELRASAQRSASFGDRNSESWIIEPQVNYRTKFGNGTFVLIAGGTLQDKDAASKYIGAMGQLSDALLENINAAASIVNGGSKVSTYRYNALFGRLNYNWQDKYILSVNARRDGSTRFGPHNRFHNFWSVGGAWLFSNEEFFKRNFEFISFGKIRGSYGTTGSDQIGDYQYMSLYSLTNASVPYQGIVGLITDVLPNPNLQWEETKKLQLGIDLGFWLDKVVVNANFVQNRSGNQLLGYPLPSQTGFGGYSANLPALVQNRNWEFMVRGKIIQQKNLNWTGSVNFTIPKNSLIEFPGLDRSGYVWTWRLGEPIDAMRTYHWLGVAEGTGDYLYAQANGYATLTPNPVEDRNVWISRSPRFNGGFQNSISYKSIQLDLLFQFVKQNGLNDIVFSNGSFGIAYPGMFVRGYSNMPVTVLDRWQKTGDIATVARFSNYKVPDDILESDHRYTDASYISLKNVSLSYDLPLKWVNKAGFRNFRVYLHGQNLLIISKNKGLNPETQVIAALPPLQVWTVGVQVGM